MYGKRLLHYLHLLLFFSCGLLDLKGLIKCNVCFWQPEFKVSGPFQPHETNVAQSFPPWRQPCRFVVKKNNYNIIAWCSAQSCAANAADQTWDALLKIKPGLWKVMEEWLWAREHLYPRQKKALDVLRKPFCDMCSHGIHITYICRMKKYIEVCLEGPPNNL